MEYCPKNDQLMSNYYQEILSNDPTYCISVLFYVVLCDIMSVPGSNQSK